MKIKNVEDIPVEWPRLKVRKKTTVSVRCCRGVETFKVSWQDAELVSDPDLDLIVIQPNGKEYPCKKDIFEETYELASAGPGPYTFIKKATTEIVQVPAGIEVEIESLEGTFPLVSYPDYIAVGSRGEVYANKFDWVAANLEILP